MITPTRTVCYVRMLAGNLMTIEQAKEAAIQFGWPFSSVNKIVVREEAIGEGTQYPLCNKNFSPLNPCDCGDCDKVLASYSKIREAKL